MIDGLAYAKRLEAAGVPPEQAEAHAAALRDALVEMQTATKRDRASLSPRPVPIFDEPTIWLFVMAAVVPLTVALVLG